MKGVDIINIRELSISSYMDYLSKGEQLKIENTGKLGNSTVVKKQLSKYFYHVSIRNRGKEVRIGKPKFTFKDDVDEAVQSVIYREISDRARSLNYWSKSLGIGLIEMEKVEKYAEKLYGDEKRFFWQVYGYIQEAKRTIFERSWRAAINQIGGSYEMIYMALIDPESEVASILRDEDQEANIKYPLPLPDAYVGEYTLLLKELREKGIKSPISQRKNDRYKDWLKRRSFKAVWRAYKPNFNDENLAVVKKSAPIIEKSTVKERCMEYIHDYVIEKGKIDENLWQFAKDFLFMSDESASQTQRN